MATDDALLAASNELIKMRQSAGWELLMYRLAQEAENAKDDLVKADPFDDNHIMKLQNVVERLLWFEETSEELIRQGLHKEDMDGLDEPAEQGVAQSERLQPDVMPEEATE